MALTRLDDPARARETCHAARAAGRTVGVVPTMGALHVGHLELVRRARAENDLVVVSVFVNPLQFDKAVDLDRYPRDEDGDAAKLEAAGADLMVTGVLTGAGGFFPEAARAEDIPSVDPGPAAAGMEHACRVGHFDGVATIIRRLFELTAADRAYFGAKDFQQVLVAEHVAAGLNAELGEARLTVVACETVREPSGLARSSRNLRLSDAGRRAAVALSVGLFRTRRAWREGGERDPAVLERLFADEVAAAAARLVGPGETLPDLTPEYTAVRHPRTWTEARPDGPLDEGVALTAGWVEGVRPIDNLLLSGPPLVVEEQVAAVVAEAGRTDPPPVADLDLAVGERAAVLVEAPAKINPWLEVLGRRDDGLHEVDLTLLTLDLRDRLRLAWVEGPARGGARGAAARVELHVTGPAATDDVPADPTNLVHRAATQALATLGDLPPGRLVVTLDKRVPSRAGLGGGSSDAAAAVLGVLELGARLGASPRGPVLDGPAPAGADLPPGEAAWAAALAGLGADCPFFLAARATGHGQGTGTGAMVRPLDPPATADRALLVLTPDVGCPTGGVYAELASDLASRGAPRERPADGAPFNRLEPAALRLVPELATLAARLAACLPGENGASAWFLSGSGSSLVQVQAPGASAFDLDERRRLAAALCDREPRHAGVHRVLGHGVRLAAAATAGAAVGEP